MNDIKPPQWPLKFLRWFCPDHLLEEIEGDLFQKFDKDVSQFGIKKARRKFGWNALRYLRPGIIMRNKFNQKIVNMSMIQNYFRILVRVIWKRKFHSLINIIGLTFALTSALILGSFAWQETQVNKSLTDADQLYILESEIAGLSNGMSFFAPAPLVKTAVETYPGLAENYYRFYDREVTVSKNDKHFRVQSLIGDTTLIKMFGFKVLLGSTNSGLSNPYDIIITEDIALRYFGKRDVIGESLELAINANSKKEFIITTVLANPDRNSVSDIQNINAQIFLSFDNLNDFSLPEPENWNQPIISYIKRTSEAKESELAAVLQNLTESHLEKQRSVNIQMASLANYYLITDNNAAARLLTVVVGIILLILLLAIINYTNISISNAALRLKEVGVRKSLGGTRREVIIQFLSESFALTFMATILAVLLYSLVRSYFENLLGTNIQQISEWALEFWVVLIFVALATTCFAGGYPALFLSRFKAVESMKGKFQPSKTGLSFTRILITLQFSTAISVFIFAIGVGSQVNYFLEKDLGYNKSMVLTISSLPRLWNPKGVQKMESGKREFLALGNIESASLSWEIPNGNGARNINVQLPGKASDEYVPLPMLNVDEDYADVYQFELIEGKFFNAGNVALTPRTIVINKSAKDKFFLKLGDKIKVREANDSLFTIVGVTRDFNFFSLHEPVIPMIFGHTNEFPLYRYYSIKLRPGNLAESVTSIENKWKEIFPDEPFEYAFMDQRLEKLYQTEIRMKNASVAGTILMLILVFMGIVGIAAIHVSRRTKEIGIRKVLGATVPNILLLISREYIILILLSFSIGLPLSYMALERWLSSFSYQINLAWWMFALPVCTLLITTILLVGSQSLKVSLTNPSKIIGEE